MGRSPRSLPAAFGRVYLYMLAAYLVLCLVGLVVFPYRADPVKPPIIKTEVVHFYDRAFGTETAFRPGDAAEYAGVTRGAMIVIPKIQDFVDKYGLKTKRILDVGAGTGYLQDLVPDYVGLDISTTAARYFHKPFVAASATDMPFPDASFDAAWSVYVLEHVPVPEQALVEMRRVVKDGGLLYLKPTWACVPWAAQGYPVRPYADLGAAGKLIKATANAGALDFAWGLYQFAPRIGRGLVSLASRSPTKLRYIALTPNYEQFWMPDGDAANSLDFYETQQWFTSRGDECLNCDNFSLFETHDLIVRVHKSAASRAQTKTDTRIQPIAEYSIGLNPPGA